MQSTNRLTNWLPVGSNIAATVPVNSEPVTLAGFLETDANGIGVTEG